MMSDPPWEGDRELTREIVTEIVSDQFPAIQVARVEFLAEGWDFEVYLVNDDMIFRFPKRKDAALWIENEIAVLAALDDHMPIPVPRYTHIGKPSRAFPYAFAGCERLDGIRLFTLSPEDIPATAVARRLGRFLSGLHGFPTRGILDVRPSLPVDTEDLAHCRDEAERQYASIRETVPEDLRPCCDDFFRESEWVSDVPELPRCLIHHDLSMEHVLYDRGGDEITGIIDWGDTCIGDPLRDFVGMWMWGGDEITTQALASYSGVVTIDHLPCVRLMGTCVAFGELEYGIKKDAKSNLNLGLTTLGKAFSGRDRRGTANRR